MHITRMIFAYYETISEVKQIISNKVAISLPDKLEIHTPDGQIAVPPNYAYFGHSISCLDDFGEIKVIAIPTKSKVCSLQLRNKQSLD